MSKNKKLVSNWLMLLCVFLDREWNLKNVRLVNIFQKFECSKFFTPNKVRDEDQNLLKYKLQIQTLNVEEKM